MEVSHLKKELTIQNNDQQKNLDNKHESFSQKSAADADAGMQYNDDDCIDCKCNDSGVDEFMLTLVSQVASAEYTD